MSIAAPVPHNLGLLLIAASAIGFYVAARVGVDALTDLDNPRPVRVALAHWFPIALLALVAVSVGQAVIGVCVAFGTCVAALLLTLGLITSTTGDPIGQTRSSRAWPLLVPAALLTFIAGFKAHLNVLHASILLVEGVMVLMLWNAHEPSESAEAPRQRLSSMRIVRFALALLVGLVAGYVGTYATLRMNQEIPLTTPGLVAAIGLAPLLVLPMIGTGTVLAERGHASAAAESIVALCLLNLCLLLPLLVLAAMARGWYLHQGIWQTIEFPIATWRVDSVLILLMGALLTPVSLNRWRIGRGEGAALVLGYAGYLAATGVLAARW